MREADFVYLLGVLGARVGGHGHLLGLVLLTELFKLDPFYRLLGLGVLSVKKRLLLLLAHEADCACLGRFVFHLEVVRLIEVQVVIVARRKLRDVHSRRQVAARPLVAATLQKMGAWAARQTKRLWLLLLPLLGGLLGPLLGDFSSVMLLLILVGGPTWPRILLPVWNLFPH